MAMWVKLLKKMQVDKNGLKPWFYPGDWVEVGNQTALYWISQGIAVKPNTNAVVKEYVDATAGIVVTNQVDESKILPIIKDLDNINYTILEHPELLYSETMLYDGNAKIDRGLVPIGFKLLKNWQCAAPLLSYDELAIHLALPDEIDYLKATLRDLRVPVYNTSLMFIRRCEQTKELIEQWQKEKTIVKHDSLAFHMAFYKTKIVMCSLPTIWVR